MAKNFPLIPHEDKLDKYRAHLLEGAPLNKKENDMMAKYRKTHSLLCLGYSMEHVRTVLAKEYDISDSHAYLIIRDAVQLMGDVAITNKAGLRNVMYEQYMLAANLARKAEDYISMVSALDKACKLYDLYNSEMVKMDPADFMRPIQFVFTSDPVVLIENETTHTQDIEHEEAEDE